MHTISPTMGGKLIVVYNSYISVFIVRVNTTFRALWIPFHLLHVSAVFAAHQVDITTYRERITKVENTTGLLCQKTISRLHKNVLTYLLHGAEAFLRSWQVLS